MSKVKGIEIDGLKELQRALSEVPAAIAPSVIRNISRKPAAKIVSVVKKSFKPKDTGKTKRSFGVLKISNRKQTFVEVGVKGRSLAWIFMKGTGDRKKKNGASTGSIEPLGNLLHKALESCKSEAVSIMMANYRGVIDKVLKKYYRGTSK